MKFGRKKDARTAPEESAATPGSAATAETGETGDEAAPGDGGPFDADDLPEGDVDRVDLGSLLIQSEPGRELRMQVEESSGDVQAVMLVGQDGALELRAFAAPRNGDLWSEVRPQIAADMTQRGGTASEQEGPFGPELQCRIQVQLPDGTSGVQPSRIIGVNGPRWLLRATLLGRPAMEPELGAEWEQVLRRVAVRRSGEPMMVGEPLPLVLPDHARKITPPAPPASS